MCFQAVFYDHDRSRISSWRKDYSDPRALSYIYQHQDTYSLFYIKMAYLVTHTEDSISNSLMNIFKTLKTKMTKVWSGSTPLYIYSTLHTTQLKRKLKITEICKHKKERTSRRCSFFEPWTTVIFVSVFPCMCFVHSVTFLNVPIRQIQSWPTSRRFVRTWTKRPRRNLQRLQYKSDKIFMTHACTCYCVF